MYKLNEVVPVQLGNEKSVSEKSEPAVAKLMMHIKGENGSEVLIYNGINNYILQTISKELLSSVL